MKDFKLEIPIGYLSELKDDQIIISKGSYKEGDVIMLKNSHINTNSPILIIKHNLINSDNIKYDFTGKDLKGKIYNFNNYDILYKVHNDKNIEDFEINIWENKLKHLENKDHYYLTDSIISGYHVVGSEHSCRDPKYIFEKEEDAILIRYKIELLQELHSFANIMNDGWIPNWKDNFESKFGIMSISKDLVIDHNFTINNFVLGIAFKSHSIAEHALKIFGERIKIFYQNQY